MSILRCMHSDDQIELISFRGSIYGQRTTWPQIMGKLRAFTSSLTSSERTFKLLEISLRLDSSFIPLSCFLLNSY